MENNNKVAEPKTELKLPQNPLLLVVSPDEKIVASAHGNRRIYLSDIESGKVLQEFKGHRRSPAVIAFHQKHSDIFASGCVGGEVRIWNLSGGSRGWIVESECPIESLSFHPQELLLAIAAGYEIHFWDLEEDMPRLHCSTESGTEKISYVKFDNYMNRLITAIKIVSAISNEPINEIESSIEESYPNSPLNCIEYQEGSNAFESSDDDIYIEAVVENGIYKPEIRDRRNGSAYPGVVPLDDSQDPSIQIVYERSESGIPYEVIYFTGVQVPPLQAIGDIPDLNSQYIDICSSPDEKSKESEEEQFTTSRTAKRKNVEEHVSLKKKKIDTHQHTNSSDHSGENNSPDFIDIESEEDDQLMSELSSEQQSTADPIEEDALKKKSEEDDQLMSELSSEQQSTADPIEEDALKKKSEEDDQLMSELSSEQQSTADPIEEDALKKKSEEDDQLMSELSSEQQSTADPIEEDALKKKSEEDDQLMSELSSEQQSTADPIEEDALKKKSEEDDQLMSELSSEQQSTADPIEEDALEKKSEEDDQLMSELSSEQQSTADPIEEDALKKKSEEDDQLMSELSSEQQSTADPIEEDALKKKSEEDDQLMSELSSEQQSTADPIEEDALKKKSEEDDQLMSELSSEQQSTADPIEEDALKKKSEEDDQLMSELSSEQQSTADPIEEDALKKKSEEDDQLMSELSSEQQSTADPIEEDALKKKSEEKDLLKSDLSSGQQSTADPVEEDVLKKKSEGNYLLMSEHGSGQQSTADPIEEDVLKKRASPSSDILPESRNGGPKIPFPILAGFSDIMHVIHRIHCFTFDKECLPQIREADKNVVIQECMLYNEACIDVSKDGKTIVVLQVDKDRKIYLAAVYSLLPETMGEMLRYCSITPYPVSVSFSSNSQLVMVCRSEWSGKNLSTDPRDAHIYFLEMDKSSEEKKNMIEGQETSTQELDNNPQLFYDDKEILNPFQSIEFEDGLPSSRDTIKFLGDKRIIIVTKEGELIIFHVDTNGLQSAEENPKREMAIEEMEKDS